jgi:hypothetical protein
MNNNKYFLSISFPVLIGVFLLINTNYISGIEDKHQNATLTFGDFDFMSVGKFHTNEGNIIDRFKLYETK